MSARNTCDYCKEEYSKKHKHTEVCQGKKMKVGKYVGLTFQEILDQDKKYCHFILHELETGNREYLLFKKWLKPRYVAFIEEPEEKSEKKERTRKITIGKHKGKSFEEVFASDKSYVSWVKGLPAREVGKFKAFQKWLNQQKEDPNIISRGKYKGKSFEEVFEADKSYVQWVLALTSDKVGDFLPFQNWLKTQKIEDEKIIQTGKYKDADYDFVLSQDMVYAQWVVQNINDGKLLPFKLWLLEQPDFANPS